MKDKQTLGDSIDLDDDINPFIVKIPLPTLCRHSE
jgi:hypothetical protein